MVSNTFDLNTSPFFNFSCTCCAFLHLSGYWDDALGVITFVDCRAFTALRTNCSSAPNVRTSMGNPWAPSIILFCSSSFAYHGRLMYRWIDWLLSEYTWMMTWVWSLWLIVICSLLLLQIAVRPLNVLTWMGKPWAPSIYADTTTNASSYELR